MNKRIAILDTYYKEFLDSWQFNESAGYESELRRLLNFSFGTGDFYSRNLEPLGWECIDVIGNYDKLQHGWYFQNGGRHSGLHLQEIAINQIQAFDPEVVFLQDLSFFDHVTLKALGEKYVISAQCSCPLPRIENVEACDVIFTSMPHYLKKFEEAGVRAVFNPLAFEPAVADWCFPEMMPAVPTESVLMDFGRIHDVVFIGGVGAPSHWKRGMETLHAVAEAIPTFKWWGYGVETLPNGPLKQKYQGQAWGLDMYKILLQSKICLNRHGEVSEGYANNMRMFEATGCGALLLTEAAPNLSDFFENRAEVFTYDSAVEAVYNIKQLLERPERIAQTAAAGQARTLRDHTYSQRMKVVSETLKEML